MSQYTAGLNYLPQLAQNISPPTTGRSRSSVTKKRSLVNSLVYYNDNYKGDFTMFKEKESNLSDLDLADTDSDREITKDIERYMSTRSVNIKTSETSSSLLWRLFQLCVLRFLSPEKELKVLQFIEQFQQTSLYNSLKFCAKCIIVLVTWLFSLLTTCCNKFGYFSSCGQTIFRISARRLLWWMTLAKFGDLTLFAFIILCTPLLFFIAILGFIIALCCCLKELLKRLENFIKKLYNLM